MYISNTSDDLQKGLDVLSDYCQKWKLPVNTEKKHRKGGNLPRNLYFILIIVNKFVYLGITFSTGGASIETHKTVYGQALKAIQIKSIFIQIY